MISGPHQPPSSPDAEAEDTPERAGHCPAAAGRRTSPGWLRTVRLAVLALLLVLFFSEYSNLIDRYFIFHPDADLSGDPSEVGLVFEDVRFTSADGVTLHGWFVPGGDGATLVLLHGNAGNISGRLRRLADLHRWLDMNVFIFDYRGYGQSEGRPSEKGTYLDAEAALDYLATRADVDQDRIVLFGHSLGTAIAVETAVRREVHAMLLEAPFTSISAMASHGYPFVPGIGRILRTKYDSLSKIRDIGAPLLVIHGDGDATIPVRMGREIFDAATEPKRFLVIAGADHDDADVVGGATYYEAIAAFLEDAAGGQAGP